MKMKYEVDKFIFCDTDREKTLKKLLRILAVGGKICDKETKSEFAEPGLTLK